MSRRAFITNREEDARIGDIDAKRRKATASTPRIERCPHVMRFDEAAAQLMEARGPAVLSHRAADFVRASWAEGAKTKRRPNRQQLAESHFSKLQGEGAR